MPDKRFTTLLTLAAIASTANAGGPIMETGTPPSMAFARYAAGLDQTNGWSLETVEIEASLPKLSKIGRLRAIRRRTPFGKPEYQVLEMTGDQTVRQQVIYRYLSAEVRAAAIPASSVAITTENYKFRYKGSVRNGDSVAYAFAITPLAKREGLIKGELWLDGDTGADVHVSGRLVKSPSIFIKHVDIARETTLRNGAADTQVTHLSIDTRLFGKAELTIHERPGDVSARTAVIPAIAGIATPKGDADGSLVLVSRLFLGMTYSSMFGL